MLIDVRASLYFLLRKEKKFINEKRGMVEIDCSCDPGEVPWLRNLPIFVGTGSGLLHKTAFPICLSLIKPTTLP